MDLHVEIEGNSHDSAETVTAYGERAHMYSEDANAQDSG